MMVLCTTAAGDAAAATALAAAVAVTGAVASDDVATVQETRPVGDHNTRRIHRFPRGKFFATVLGGQ